jgi:hypothetical protein
MIRQRATDETQPGLRPEPNQFYFVYFVFIVHRAILKT